MRFALLMGALVVLAATISNAEVEACRRCRLESPLVVTSVSPDGVLPLGTDLTIHYFMAPHAGFNRVHLRVTNKNGELVYLAANLPASPGAHQAVWLKGQWNQAPGAGALANPLNGPYAVALIAERLDGSSITYRIAQATQLVLECDFEQDKPSKDEISSGLSRAMLDLKRSNRLQVGLVRKGGMLADTVYALAAPVFSAIVEEDLDNDPTELEVKSAHVCQRMQSTFPDGEYNVVLTNARTGAGLPLSQDGILDTWIIKLR